MSESPAKTPAQLLEEFDEAAQAWAHQRDPGYGCVAERAEREYLAAKAALEAALPKPPEPVVRYHNVYRYSDGWIEVLAGFDTRQAADTGAVQDRVAVLVTTDGIPTSVEAV